MPAAARVGDTTTHGGSIVGPGISTVLIGGMPAGGNLAQRNLGGFRHQRRRGNSDAGCRFAGTRGHAYQTRGSAESRTEALCEGNDRRQGPEALQRPCAWSRIPASWGGLCRSAKGATGHILRVLTAAQQGDRADVQ